MSVEIRLNSEQFSHYEDVLQKSKIEFKHRGSIIELDKDNFYLIRNTLQDAREKLVILKTKKPHHMERLYYLQEVLGHINRQAPLFPVAVEEEITTVSKYELEDSPKEEAVE